MNERLVQRLRRLADLEKQAMLELDRTVEFARQQGMTHQQIGDAIGVTETAVRKRLQRRRGGVSRVYAGRGVGQRQSRRAA